MYPAKIGQWIPRPLGMNLETTFAPNSKIHMVVPKFQNQNELPNIQWHPEK